MFLSLYRFEPDHHVVPYVLTLLRCVGDAHAAELG